MLICFSILLGILSGGSAFAAWTFQFSGQGARAEFVPSEGVYFQASPDSKRVLKHKVKLLGFDVTDGPEGPGVRKGGSSFAAFYVTADGLYFLTETGAFEPITLAEDLFFADGSYSYEALPDLRSQVSGHRYRSVLVKTAQVDGRVKAILTVIHEYRTRQSIELPNLPIADRCVPAARILPGASGTEILSLQIESGSSRVLERMLLSDWSLPNPFQRFRQSGQTLFTARLTGAKHFVPRLPGTRYPDVPIAEWKKTVSALIAESERTGAPAMTRISASDLDLLASLVQDAELGVSGLIEFHPLADGSDDALDRWTLEIENMKWLTQRYRYLMAVQHDGAVGLIYHPGGSDAHLEDSISPCNLLWSSF